MSNFIVHLGAYEYMLGVLLEGWFKLLHLERREMTLFVISLHLALSVVGPVETLVPSSSSSQPVFCIYFHPSYLLSSFHEVEGVFVLEGEVLHQGFHFVGITKVTCHSDLWTIQQTLI